MKLKFVTLLAASACAAACSKGGGDSAPRTSINSKIGTEGTQAFTGQTAIFEAGKGLGSQPPAGGAPLASSGFDFVAGDGLAASIAPGTADAKAMAKAKTQNVRRAMQRGGCSIVNDRPRGETNPSGPAASFPQMKMRVAGGSCPLELSLEMTMAGDGGANPCASAAGAQTCSFKMNVKMNYRVTDSKLAAELGVTSGSLVLTGTMTQVMPEGRGGGQGEAMNMAIKSALSFEMKAVDLQSHAYIVKGTNAGDMKMVMSTSVDQPGGQQIVGAMKEDLSYLDEATQASQSFSASVTMNGNSGDEHYFVDGVAVTTEVYQAERNKIANSIIKFGKNQRDDQPGPNPDDPNGDRPAPQPQPQPQPPGPFPQPQPQPQPQPNPYPSPNPVPQPAPTSAPAEVSRWICVIQDYSTKKVYAGYGPVEFTASSKAKQSCQAEGGTSCVQTPACEQQTELRHDAWYCETKNYGSGRVFGGTGASRTEAVFFSANQCASASRESAGSCATMSSSTCAHQ